jgi:hypothetical protein
VKRGYDVWLFDYRASPDLPSSRSSFTQPNGELRHCTPGQRKAHSAAATPSGRGPHHGRGQPQTPRGSRRVQRRREEIRFSYFVFGASSADVLAPVVAELAGR